MRPEDDALVAELLLKRGWLDAARLRRAAEICEAARTLDLAQDLLQVLVQKGFLGETQLRELDGELGLDYLTRPEYLQAISGYRIWGKLEPWGLGVVFRALQLSMERPVALKVLAPAAAADTELLTRFLAEGRAAGQVDHPNIVGALDLGHSGQYHYYAVELVEGQRLRDALRGGAMPVAAALQIAQQMAHALAHIHELGVTHRDVQPENIVLLPDGTARLCNLGAARQAGDPSAVATGIPIGTPGYTAPELLAPTPRADIRSDIYSLGATLYYALTGHRPGRAGSGPLLPPALLRPELPGAVSDLVRRMTAADPAERPQDPSELLRAIEEAQGAPLQAGPVVPRPEPHAEPPPAVRVAAPGELALAPAEGAPPPAIARPASADGGPGQGLPRRRLASALWTAAFVALAGAFVAASVWALWSKFGGGRGPAAPPVAEARPGGDGQKAEPPKEPDHPLPRPAPEVELAESARRVVDDALAFDKANPEGHIEAALRLRRALLVAAEAPVAIRLRVRLATRHQILNGEANSAYGELSDRLAALRAQGRLGAALQACQAFPASARYGPWAEILAARFAELGEDAERQYLTLAAKGAAALLGQRPDDGVACYKGIADIGVPWMSRAAEPLAAVAAAYVDEHRTHLKDAAARRAVLDRRRALGALTRHVAAVHDEIKKRDYAKALDLCQAVPEALRDGERGKALASLERRLGLLVEVWEAVLKGPPSAIGKPFNLHGADWVIEGFVGTGLNAQLVLRTRTDTGERTLRQPVWRLPGIQLARLAEWAVERGPAGPAAVKVGLLCLTEGEAQRAKQKLQEAEKAGEDVTTFLDEMDAEALVAAALTAHRQGQWAEARKLLESSLDRYGATSPVILSYRALSNALADCALKLDESAEPLPASPPALPERLHWLTLLPETRLGSAPPAAALDEHFATPLRRCGPQRLGLDTWRDYTLVLRWSADAPCRLLLGARLAEPQPGVFHYYYVTVGDGQVTLGRRDAAGDKVLAAKPYPLRAGGASAKHRLAFTLAGASLTVETEDTSLEAVDPALTAGRALLAAPEGAVAVQELVVGLRPQRPAAPREK